MTHNSLPLGQNQQTWNHTHTHMHTRTLIPFLLQLMEALTF